MFFRTLLLWVFILAFTRTENKLTTFAGKWQFDEAHSSYSLTTKVIKDLPDSLKEKIPNHDVPRLLGVPRYFSAPPTVVIKVVAGRLTINAPGTFYGWIPFDAVFLVDGKQREKNVGTVQRSSSHWEQARIVREWNIRDAALYDSSEGRDILSLSEDGKILTVESHNTYKLRMMVDDRPYELDDIVDIRSVFVKIR